MWERANDNETRIGIERLQMRQIRPKALREYSDPRQRRQSSNWNILLLTPFADLNCGKHVAGSMHDYQPGQTNNQNEINEKQAKKKLENIDRTEKS